MFQPFKDFYLVGLLTLAIIFQPASLLIFAPSSMFEAQAQESREKKEKPKGRRSQVLSKRAFSIVEEAQNRIAEEDYVGALSQLQQIAMARSSRLMKKPLPYRRRVSSMPAKAIMPRPFRLLKRPPIPAICRRAW